MTSSALLQTMFVNTNKSPPTSPSQSQFMNSFPSPPRPLDPVFTLVESRSCIQLPTDLASSTLNNSTQYNFPPQYGTADYPQTPRSAYASPVQKAFQAALRSSPLNLYRTRIHKRGMSENDDDYSNPRAKTAFRPQKSGKGTTNWQLKQFAEATLGSGSLRKAVKLPEGEDKDEWLAVNVVDFYNQINLLYGSITEFCSPQSCPEMKATDEFEYLWQDDDQYKKPTKMPAPEYVEHLMSWVQATIDNEQIFPSRIGVPFPKSFRPRLQQIFKRLYRVYAHIYCHHYPVIVNLGLEPHLNTSFKHYVLFVEEHGLNAGQRDYWGPMVELVESMKNSD